MMSIVLRHTLKNSNLKTVLVGRVKHIYLKLDPYSPFFLCVSFLTILFDLLILYYVIVYTS